MESCLGGKNKYGAGLMSLVKGVASLAASDTDRAGCDAVVAWMKDVGLEIKIDRIGNIFVICSSRKSSRYFLEACYSGFTTLTSKIKG